MGSSWDIIGSPGELILRPFGIFHLVVVTLIVIDSRGMVSKNDGSSILYGHDIDAVTFYFTVIWILCILVNIDMPFYIFFIVVCILPNIINIWVECLNNYKKKENIQQNSNPNLNYYVTCVLLVFIVNGILLDFGILQSNVLL